MVSRDIPERSRRLVQFRDLARCGRCGVEGRLDWHHRRSRSVRDLLTHSPCNGISLCRTCHRWAHDNPFEARQTGFIVSRYADPQEVPIQHSLFGEVFLTTDGSWLSVPRVQGGGVGWGDGNTSHEDRLEDQSD